MNPLFVTEINIDDFTLDESEAKNKHKYFVGGVCFKIRSEEDLDKAILFLRKHAVTTYVKVTKIKSIDDVIALLDDSAAGVIVNGSQLQLLQSVSNIDLKRIILSHEETDVKSLDELKDDRSIGHYINIGDHDEGSLAQEHGTRQGPVLCNLDKPNVASARSAIGASMVPIIPRSYFKDDAGNGQIDIASLIVANITSDRPDGLFSTLVVDERGIALGLVYSSSESIAASLKTGKGVYQSRKRGLWYKGETSGDIQELIKIELDCDNDCLKFIVKQKGKGTKSRLSSLEPSLTMLIAETGFCHLGHATCFGPYKGISRLQKTLESRRVSAPEGSYTSRLFDDPKLLNAKIMEEASELCEAKSSQDISFEAADLLYFALTKCVAADISLGDVERVLDKKSLRISRRKGDAKKPFHSLKEPKTGDLNDDRTSHSIAATQSDVSERPNEPDKVKLRRLKASQLSTEKIEEALRRPSQRSTSQIMDIVKPIVEDIKMNGDSALLQYTHKFEKAITLTSTVLRAPFSDKLMQLDRETIEAIDVSFENIRRFHDAQKDEEILQVDTMPGVTCSRFSRPIERVGLYVPGGTAVLPSTAMMLGVPAMVAGCKKIILASPPRPDGTITPEIVYIAHKVGASSIVLAGGAQAVAALAYGTESITKVDKILGPGNQFVTAAKMLVSNDTSAGVGIDMPAGPSEVMVIADSSSIPSFVASDLLSQAEHGVDSQVILLAVALPEDKLTAIESELHDQACRLPRVDIVKKAIEHSVTILVSNIEEAMTLCNEYAPEHLILQLDDAKKHLDLVENAGSVFIGPWTPESVGDYSAGVNHSLRTYL